MYTDRVSISTAVMATHRNLHSSQPDSDSGAQFYLWNHLKVTTASDSGDNSLGFERYGGSMLVGGGYNRCVVHRDATASGNQFACYGES